MDVLPPASPERTPAGLPRGLKGRRASACSPAAPRPRLAAEKLEQVESQVSHSGSMAGFMLPLDRKKEEGQLHKITRDAAKAAIEQAKGMSSQARAGRRRRPPPGAAGDQGLGAALSHAPRCC